MEKPILYYQFDKEELLHNSHIAHPDSGYFKYKEHGFGEVCEDEGKLLQETEKVIQNSYIVDDVYLERMQNTFAFKDGKCCERVYNLLDKTE